MSWHFCIVSREHHTLSVCGGSLTKGNNYRINTSSDGWGCGFGHTNGTGYGDSVLGEGNVGDGHGLGYDLGAGNGSSPESWL